MNKTSERTRSFGESEKMAVLARSGFLYRMYAYPKKGKKNLVNAKRIARVSENLINKING